MVPENTPAKFRNKDGTLNAESLVKSYLALEKQFHMLANTLKEMEKKNAIAAQHAAPIH